MQAKPIKKAWERGMRSGRLRVPEDIPFIINVNDFAVCGDSEGQVSR